MVGTGKVPFESNAKSFLHGISSGTSSGSTVARGNGTSCGSNVGDDHKRAAAVPLLTAAHQRYYRQAEFHT